MGRLVDELGRLMEVGILLKLFEYMYMYLHSKLLFCDEQVHNFIQPLLDISPYKTNSVGAEQC